MAFLLADLTSVRADELLDFLEREIPRRGWNLLDELNLLNWRETARNPDARQVGEAFSALFARGDDLTPQERERLLKIVDSEDAKRKIANFLRANIEIIRKLKKRHVGYRHTAFVAKRAAEQNVIRMNVFAHADDAEKVRAFAAELLVQRDIKMPELTLGRPKKNKET